MLVSGLTYRLMAARVGTPLATAPIAPGALAEFPMQIADWVGEEVPLDAAIIRGTQTDAHINRRYSRHNDLESVSFYVACGVRTSEMAYHRPDVCYPGAGWTRVEQHPLELPLSEETELPCTIFQFARGELRKETVTVLHYWIVDGRFCRDVSPLRSRLWRLSAKVDSIAQVQIVASSTETLTSEAASKLVCAFAVDSASAVARLFGDIQRSHEREPVCPKETEDKHR